SGSRETARTQAGCRVAGSSTAITAGRRRRIACRSSMANSRRPGTTGKYVKRPRRRLAKSGSGGSDAPGIPQRLLPEHLHHGDLEGLGFVSPLRGQALQLDGESRDVDAVPHGVALVGSVGHLEEIGDVVENALLGEGQVLAKDVQLLVPLREVDEDLGL